MPCTSPFVARVPEQVDVCEDKLRGEKTCPEAAEPVLSMHSADEWSSSTSPLLCFSLH